MVNFEDVKAFAVLLGPDAVPELVRNTIRLIPGVDTVSAQTDSGELRDFDCPEGHICANHPIHAQAKIIRQRMDVERLTAQLKIAQDAFMAIRNITITADAIRRHASDPEMPYRLAVRHIREAAEEVIDPRCAAVLAQKGE